MVNNKTGEWHTQATTGTLEDALDFRRRWNNPNYPGVNGEEFLLINSFEVDEDGEMVDGTEQEH